MPSRREIREAVIQFLYCTDLEGGADPTSMCEPFWDFVTESDRRALQMATFRTVQHLATGRDVRLEEFAGRKPTATATLSAVREAESLRDELNRVAELESKWSSAFDAIVRLPKKDDDDELADALEKALRALFSVDRDLALSRQRFLHGMEDFPALRGSLEAVAGSIRRLQRISDRMRMVEEPERFPEQADLAKLRTSRAAIQELRRDADVVIRGVLQYRQEIDERLSLIVENFSPERIDPVDRAVLRLGVYEILHTNTPAKVVINEAVELAKRFGTTDSGRFVNGVLDRLAKGTEQPAN